MTKMNKMVCFFAATVMTLGMSASVSLAADFAGFTDPWGYAKVSASCRKSNSDSLAYINWMTSSQSSHKQWFYMVDTNTSAGSKAQLLNYLNAHTYYPGHTFGHYFELKSKREHVIDPQTYVTGYWNP